MASGDDLKAAAKCIAELEITAQVQLLLEPVQLSISGSVPKELVVLLTNRRIILLRRKTSILRGNSVKRSYSILGITSIEISETKLTISVCSSKEEETICLCATTELVERIATTIYDSLRLIQCVRPSKDTNNIVIPESQTESVSMKQVTAIIELYMTVCDHYQMIPLSSFIEYMKECGIDSKHELNISAAIGRIGDKQLRPSNQDLKAITDSLRHQTVFDTVVVGEHLILNEGAIDAVFTIALSTENEVRALTFSGDNWRQNVFRRLEFHLKNNASCALRDISVMKNALCDDGLFVLIQKALDCSIQLHRLILRCCQINLKSQSLHAIFAKPFFTAHETGIQILDLSANDISKTGCRCLGEFLRQSRALRRLSLAHSNANLKIIIESIVANPILYQSTMEILNISGLKLFKEAALLLRSVIGQTVSLREICLTQSKPNDFAIANLFDAVANNPNKAPMLLDFGACELGSSMSKALTHSVRRHGQLSNIATLSLRDNEFASVESVRELCDALSQVGGLRHLALDGNIVMPSLFTKKKIMTIGSALGMLISALPELQHLSLSGSDKSWLGDGLIQVLLSVGKHPKLKAIDIAANKITKAGFEALAGALSKSKSLVRVDMDRNPIDSESMDMLSNSITLNQFLPLQSIDVREALSAGIASKKQKRWQSTRDFAKCILERIEARCKETEDCPSLRAPAHMNNRLLAVDRIDGSFVDQYDDGESLKFIRSIIALSLKQQTSSTTSTSFSGIKSLGSKHKTSLSCSMVTLADMQFGVPVSDVSMVTVAAYGGSLPRVLLQMDAYLDKQNAVDCVGIFRLAPDEYESKAVKRELNAGTFVSCDDVNSVANNMKVWFRDMPEKLLKALSLDDMKGDSSEQINAAIDMLSEPFKSIFQWALDVWVKYARHADQSKMNATNISIVFAPNLYPTNDEDPMADMQTFQQVCKFVERAIIYREQSYNSQNLKDCLEALGDQPSLVTPKTKKNVSQTTGRIRDPVGLGANSPSSMAMSRRANNSPRSFEPMRAHSQEQIVLRKSPRIRPNLPFQDVDMGRKLQPQDILEECCTDTASENEIPIEAENFSGDSGNTKQQQSIFESSLSKVIPSESDKNLVSTRIHHDNTTVTDEPFRSPTFNVEAAALSDVSNDVGTQKHATTNKKNFSTKASTDLIAEMQKKLKKKTRSDIVTIETVTPIDVD